MALLILSLELAEIGISNVTIKNVIVTILTFGIGFAITYILGNDKKDNSSEVL